MACAIAEKELFIDKDFAPDLSSLRYVYCGNDEFHRMVFKRPKEIRYHAQLYGLGGVCRIPLPPRPWNDRAWFRLSLAVASLNSRFMEKLIPGFYDFKQNFGVNYDGSFCFRLWTFGEYKEVIVDDALPVLDKRLAFCPEVGDPPEFWCALLEKAYAKQHSAYEAIEYGNPVNALTDLTGNICQGIHLDGQSKENAFIALHILHMNNSFLVTWREKRSFTDRDLASQWHESSLYRSLSALEPSLSKSKTYVSDMRLFVITAVTKFTMKRGQRECMLRLVDPSKAESTWQGDFAFNDFRSWKDVSRVYMDSFHPKSSLEGNEFWIRYSDFCKHFSDVISCSSSEPFDLSLTSQERIYDTSGFNDNYITRSLAWMHDNENSAGKKTPRASVKVKRQLSNYSKKSMKSSHSVRFEKEDFPSIQISKAESIKKQLSLGSNSLNPASYLRASFGNRFIGGSRSGSSRGVSMQSVSSRSTSSMLSRRTHGTTVSSDLSSFYSRSTRSYGRSDLSCRSSIEADAVHSLRRESRSSSLPDILQSQLVECLSISSLFEKRADAFKPCGTWRQLVHFVGSWREDTSGGPPRHEMYNKNQRFSFHVTRSKHDVLRPSPYTDDGKVHVLIALMRDYRSSLVKQKSNSGRTTFGFAMYKSKQPIRDGKKKLSKLTCIDDTISDPETRELVTLCVLDPGHYVVVPYTLEPGQEGKFLLRILCDVDHSKNTTGCVIS